MPVAKVSRKAGKAPRRTNPLTAYRAKRNFESTREPAGELKRGERRSFVIQKHDASRLHYDFRLELGGTLKSWAVPKGVPWEKGEKRLAVQVEDHPLEYADFEGVIPEGEYGGGTVMVWDRGTYEPLGGSPEKDLRAGKLHFALHGEKLEGEWTLVRIAHAEKNEWLLIKSGASIRPLSRKRDDESALSGRSMARIARERDAEWHSKEKKAVPRLDFVAPMKATLVASPPAAGEWSHELKFDGYRTLAIKEGREVRLFSSNAKDFSKRFPEIAEAVAGLPVERAMIDGEIVALDDEGRSSFQLLQALEMDDERPPLAYYVFDLLHQEESNLQDEPLHERRGRLEKLLERAPEPLRFSAEIEGDPKRLLEEIKRRGLEGIIAKERSSRYEAGRRGRAWLKLKCVAEQELVIGGYTPPEGTRQHFGALLVGYFQRGKLHFAGKVGTGFTGATLQLLHRKMEAISAGSCPFVDLPEKESGRWAQNITARDMKRCRWTQPKLVCQVRFGEWTRDGKLRHPVFIGLREDKSASEVKRERPA